MIWPKAPDGAWLRPRAHIVSWTTATARPAFRHELASALALFAILETFAPQHPALLGPWSEAFAAIGCQVRLPQRVRFATDARDSADSRLLGRDV